MGQQVTDRPVWADVPEPTWLRPAEPPAAATVAVIGGGLMGVATAYWLSRSGIDTVLLERDNLGAAASGRNAGLALHNSRPIENPDLVDDVLHDEKIDADCRTTGHLALASSPQMWERIRAEVTDRPSSAPALHALTRKECEEVIGMRISRRYHGGRWLPSGRTLHPVKLVHGLARAAQEAGVRICSGCAVFDVDGQQVRTSRGTVVADHVVFAAGAGTARLLDSVAPFLQPQPREMVATTPVARSLGPGMAVDWGTAYWRQCADGTVVLGGAPVEFLGRALPDLPPLALARRWVGVMDCTPDDQPVIGRLTRPDQWIIAGFCGHGIPGAVGAGRALSDYLATGTMPAALRAFRPDRFLSR
ncbi:NAD(P)/FAD-dependent oxidoreductase [Nocardia sp. NPDC050175]|uniref:NAD(P)/FAD-dependent oxidoreductase n=1 Tax=Nocardia sp. NPDC050175 TaxID=3364317 RepID=UPI00378B5720